MHTCVIINPNAGTADQSALLLKAISHSDNIEHRVSSSSEDGRRKARHAAENGFECVAAAGGDGTVNGVLNGIMEADATGVCLGIIPLGTGNDLARTLDIPLEARDALAVLEQRNFQDIDLFRASAGGEDRYGINASAGGFSGQVDEIMTEGIKQEWGPLAYLAGAAQTLPDLQDFKTSIELDGDALEDSNLLNVIVANGRTVAGGKRVAPRANPRDGLLDVVLIKWGTLVELAEVGALLLTGDYLESEHVIFKRAQKVRVRSEPGMRFNVDGELFTNEPIDFHLLPKAIKVACGSNFSAEAPEEGVQRFFNRES